MKTMTPNIDKDCTHVFKENKLKKETAIIDNLNNERVATLVEDETIGSHGDIQFNEWFERLVDEPKDLNGENKK